jgi:hypothetical protein
MSLNLQESAGTAKPRTATNCGRCTSGTFPSEDGEECMSCQGSYLLGGNGSFVYKNPGLDCTWVCERVLTTNAGPCMRNLYMSSSKCPRLGICDCIATGFVMPVRQPLSVLMFFNPAVPHGFMRIQTQLYESLPTIISCMIIHRYAWKTFTNGAPMSIEAGACRALPAPTPLALLLPVLVLTAST